MHEHEDTIKELIFKDSDHREKQKRCYLYGMSQEVNYPQYRKFPTNAAYFKIHSATQWEEIQVIGKKHILNYFTVKIMPDRNYIHDLTFEYENNWLKIEEEEYEAVKEKCSA